VTHAIRTIVLRAGPKPQKVHAPQPRSFNWLTIPDVKKWLDERDACALVVSVRKTGEATHGILKRALAAPGSMGHRCGEVNGEGDERGVMTGGVLYLRRQPHLNFDQAAIQRRLAKGTKVVVQEVGEADLQNLRYFLSTHAEELRQNHRAEEEQKILGLLVDPEITFVRIAPYGQQEEQRFATDSATLEIAGEDETVDRSLRYNR
jgi:glutamate synthase domain-containing protein 1